MHTQNAKKAAHAKANTDSCINKIAALRPRFQCIQMQKRIELRAILLTIKSKLNNFACCFLNHILYCIYLCQFATQLR